MPHIALLGTGGTIASRALPTGGSGATDTSGCLLDSLGASGGTLESESGAITVDAVDVLGINSFNLSLADLRTLAEAVRAQMGRSEIDGVVITHGTDTIEETAALLAAVHNDLRPVVLTGAQRSPENGDADGPRNLREAIKLAADPASRTRGCLLSFAGEVYEGFGLRKRYSTAPRPFASAFSGPVGHHDNGVPSYIGDGLGTRIPRLAAPGPGFDNRRIDIVTTYPGADAALLLASLNAGAAGVVLLGAGTGNPGVAFIETIAAATAAGVVVALGSRTDGPVVPVYGNGGAVDAVAAGAVPIGRVPATQARILIALLLDQHDPAAAARALREICQIH